MPYNLFPAVDENFNFPEEVRIQLAKSEQLRNLVVPMSQETRDALTEDELWVGRTIFNTTTNTLESLNSSEAWVAYLDETYSFPEPTPFWDENFDIPEEVRIQLAKSEQLRNMVVPMAETVRNNLAPEDKWNGRTIFNTTANRAELWSTVSNTWLGVLDENYVPTQPAWSDWDPVLEYLGSNTIIPNYIGSGRVIHTDSTISCMFTITFTDDITEPSGLTDILVLNAPIQGNVEYYAKDFTGLLILNQTEAGGTERLGVFRTKVAEVYSQYHPLGYFALQYYNSNTSLVSVQRDQPQLWTNGCTISGSITYPLYS